ncbi:MAG TPA: hypothetical protein VIM50_03480 [Candidatus Limnocylindria bacterium]|jgi:hypothetical protein
MRNVNKTLIATGIALTLAGGAAAATLMPNAGATALASTPAGAGLTGTERGPLGGDLLAAAATYIGISTDAIKTELQAGASLADVAVAHGKTRDGLIAALNAAASTQIATLVDTKGLVGQGGKGEGFGLEGGAPLTAAATYLGLSTTDLQAKLAAGQTPSAVAAATAGKTREGLIAAIVADGKAKIDAAQAAGTMTAAKATEETAELTEHATRFVDSIRGGRHR